MSKPLRLSLWAASLAALALLAFGFAAQAQPFPNKVIRIVSSTPAGTPPEIISRLVANEVAEAEGWKIIVEPKPGAIGTIAGAEVLRQPADGYTLYAASLPVVAGPALRPNIGYRLDADFTPLIKLSASYNVLVVNPLVPVNTVTELVAYLKSKGDSINFNYSSGGFGTPAHLIGEMFKLRTGVTATHVPYQALPPAMGDLINGTNHFMFITTLPVIELVNTGRLRALAVTGPKRIPVFKDVPSIAEAGFADLAVEDWVGLLVRSGTPPEIVTQLNAAIGKALQSPRVREALAKLGAEPGGGSPQAFKAQFDSELARWAKVVKDAGIKMQP